MYVNLQTLWAANLSLYSHPPSTNQRATSQFSLKSKFQLHFIQKRTLGTLPGSPQNNQSPSCFSTDCKTSTYVVSNIKDCPDMGSRNALQFRCPQINCYKL
ncbi:hypothetical protein TNCV_1055341 [Trichonephila clavipes]|nr:hypothetical protein TNCV_1055341 [Trichonephila clavipes]